MRLLLFGVLAFVLSSCSAYREHRERQNIVNETYIHKYGLEVPEDDWSNRGRNGQVVTQLVNGVKVCRNYVGGQLNGEVTHSFPHIEKIETSQNYVQGYLVSEKNYYSSGIPSKEIEYLTPTSYRTTTWYQSGTPRSREEMDNGFLYTAEYYTINNQVDSRISNGQGMRVNRDEWGQLISHDTIENGEMVLRKMYHPNSTPKELISYRNGKIEGQKRIYLPTGEPKAIEEWKADHKNGKTILFENGEAISEITFVDDLKTGVERRFSDGSTVVEEITWKKDKRHGPSYTYLGDRTQVDWYHEGRRVNKSQYDNLQR
ncbi:MAG: hypothetical protein WD595_03130 [Waddliaceae bacterium]